MYIFLVDCTVFKRSKKTKIHRPRQATQFRSWAGIGKVGILELEFFLAFEEEKKLYTRAQRAGRYFQLRHGSGSGRVSGIFAKKNINRVFSGIGNLDRVHPNVVQFLYERFFNVTRRAYDGVDDDD